MILVYICWFVCSGFVGVLEILFFMTIAPSANSAK